MQIKHPLHFHVAHNMFFNKYKEYLAFKHIWDTVGIWYTINICLIQQPIQPITFVNRA